MRLSHEIVDAIIRERAHKPIVGDVLLIGRQSVALPTSEVLALFREHGVAARGDEFAAQQVESAPGRAGPPRIEDGKLLRILGVDNVRTLAVTPAERGDITHQLGTPLPQRLVGSADFIVDGGSLANRFDPAATIENYAALLRPGGRLIAINTLSNHFDPYTMPSPSWYLDYFVGNGFADCRVYVVVYRLHEPANAFCVDIDCLLDPKREVRNFASRYEMAVIVFAEKSVESTTHVRPLHAHQRPSLEWDRYRRNLERIKQNPRPHIVRSRGRMNYFDVQGGHLFMRRDYAAVDPSSEEPRVRADSNRVAAASPAPPARLRILCVGTGRDGTQSLNYMIQRIFDALGGPRSMHEYGCRELNQAFCDLRETGEGGHAAEIGRIIADCPWDCIVSNGYAAVLPAFAERYGRGLKVIHLRRADRDACIASLKRNCELFPAAYGYYAASSAAVVKRMAAFHFGEMSRAQWDNLPIDEKFGWYYDRTHALVRAHASLFDNYIEVTTESLDEGATRRTIADFVAGPDAILPPRAHLNASVIDIASFQAQHRHKMHWLMGRLNVEEVARDDVYALDYFLEKFVAWTGYQITNAPQLAPARPAPIHRIERDIDRAIDAVATRLREIESLKSMLLERRDRPAD